ncbi:MAG: hypothetical protein ACK4N5_19790, partial [Myxococcales bacterium]
MPATPPIADPFALAAAQSGATDGDLLDQPTLVGHTFSPPGQLPEFSAEPTNLRPAASAPLPEFSSEPTSLRPAADGTQPAAIDPFATLPPTFEASAEPPPDENQTMMLGSAADVA